MTRSLPGAPDLQLKAPSGWAGRLQSVATNVGLKVLPWVPTRAKRLLAAGRSVTIDGNTLDPTLQLMLSTQRAVGVNGLVVDEDLVASRSQAREIALAFAGPQVHVGVSDLSIPGPAGQIPARHYRPTTAEPTPLLVFYHGGGWTIGDLDTHDALCRLTCRDADIHVLSIDYRRAPEPPRACCTRRRLRGVSVGLPTRRRPGGDPGQGCCRRRQRRRQPCGRGVPAGARRRRPPWP